MPRSRKDKELSVKIAGETIKLREGEIRIIHLPMTLRITEGILIFTPPNPVIEEVSSGKDTTFTVVAEEEVKDV